MSPVPSAILPPEKQCSWFLLGFSVHLPGPGSTMATSWQNLIPFITTDHHSTALMSIPILCLEKSVIQMVHYSITSSPHAQTVAWSVVHTNRTKQYPVPCALSNNHETNSTSLSIEYLLLLLFSEFNALAFRFLKYILVSLFPMNVAIFYYCIVSKVLL